MATFEELETKLALLKKNRDNVPLETLKTKYKAPYEKLLAEIAGMASEILKEESCRGIKVAAADSENLIAEINQAIQDERRDGGILQRIQTALFKKQDIREFKTLIGEMHALIEKRWLPYWESHCCLYAGPECFEEPYPEPRIYNDLTDQFLVGEKWESHPEWKVEKPMIITSGACHILAQAMRKGEQNG